MNADGEIKKAEKKTVAAQLALDKLQKSISGAEYLTKMPEKVQITDAERVSVPPPLGTYVSIVQALIGSVGSIGTRAYHRN